MIRRPPASSRRGIFIGLAVVLLILVFSSARFYTDVLWFREVRLSSVLWTSLRTQFGVAVVAGLGVGLVVWLNLWVATRLRPAYLPSIDAGGGRQPVDQYRDALEPYLRRIRLAVAGVVALLSALGAAGAWRTFLLWSNRVPFGESDPQFGKDIGFYVFELPFLDMLTDWAWFALMASLVLSAGAHYLYGSIRPEARLAGVLPGALAHISVLLGLLALVKGARYWLGQYALNFSPRGVVTGASYTDVHAQLPALKLLALISLISAALFIVNIRFRRLALPLAAVGIWVLTAFLAGGVWPWWVQRFSVEPQEPQREGPFIGRNIEATRAAFDLADIEVRPFAATTDLEAAEVQANETLLQNVRLWDPEVLQAAYTPLQAIRTHYRFPDVDVDRYEVDGRTRQVLLSARELSLDDIPERSRKWSNIHLQLTHGFGVVASLANEATAAGQPEFLVRDLPGTTTPGAEEFDLDQPRLYYGEEFEAHDFSVVKTEQSEFDYPTEDETQRVQYEGAGGIEVGGIFKRLAFAVRERDPNLVLSNVINPDSKILLYRNVRDRVLRAAPFLSLDHDPFVAAVDGRLTWLLDGYTSTRYYPYSQRLSMDEIIGSTENGVLSGESNYVRNSVKIAVDAYDGTMTFYVIDDEDPIIRAWGKAFPDLFTDEEPPLGLREHFRYPEDLFKIQSEAYLTYHMTDPQDFYLKQDEWNIAKSVTEPFASDTASVADATGAPVDPTYLLIELPGETEERFVLTRPFTPHRRDNMIAILAAHSDPDQYGELLTLQFPRQRVVSGPLQVDNLINQEPEISQLKTLLGQRGSQVIFGSLVTLPIEDSILYVQPLFVSAEAVGIPELKRVILVLGEKVVVGENFEEALAQLFDLDAEPPPPDEGGDDEEPPPPGRDDDDLQALVARAAALYAQAQEALSAGDFERYGRLIEQVGRLLERADGRAGTGTGPRP
ncbi:MAG: UPF0182 family protein [Actinomycetota bacterium]